MSPRATFLLVLFGLLVVGTYGVLRVDAQREETAAAVTAQETAETEYAGLTQAERRAMRHRIENTVREIGTIESASSDTVFSRVPGSSTLISILPEGEVVQKGQVVAELDNSAITEKLMEQRIRVASAEAQVQQAAIALKSQTRQTAVSVAAAKKAVGVAKLAAGKWQHEFELKMETIAAELRVAEARRKAARTRVSAGGNDAIVAMADAAEAEAALKTAAARRKLLAGPEKEFQAAVRELEVLRRESELLQIEQKQRSQIAATSAALKAAERELAVATRQRDQLARNLESCKLRAPRKGTLVYANQRSRRSEPVVIEAGTSVRERQAVVSIVDFTRLQVRVPVHESRIGKVRVGQPVKLAFDAIPDGAFAGTVSSVSTIAERGAWPNTDMKLFTVIVSIRKPNSGMKVGMTGVVEIEVSKKGR